MLVRFCNDTDVVDVDDADTPDDETDTSSILNKIKTFKLKFHKNMAAHDEDRQQTDNLAAVVL
jgi:hypothetical protein